MRKKLLYVIMSLVFAIALCGSGVAVMTTSDALAKTSNDVTAAQGEDIGVSEGTQVGEDVEVAASVTAANIQNSQNGWTKTPASTTHGYGGVGYYKRYSYSGSTNIAGNVQSEVLPAGTYLLEAWGAQGGNDGQRGGHGGYIRAIYNFPSATTVYIVVGGYGTNSTNSSVAGGYNGGGRAGSYGSSGAGGGATHFATASGTLNSLKNNKGAVILVAGGGGGGGNDNPPSVRGWGGVTPGPNNAGQTYINGNNNFFGLGQNRNDRGGNVDGGGGGGGYYGGYAATADCTAAGGSSYYNPATSGTFRYVGGYAHANGNTTQPHPTNIAANMAFDVNASSIPGYARITCLNNVPTDRNATVAATIRGQSTTITPSTAGNDSGSYHTTLQWAESNRIYTNAACTTLVSSNVLSVTGMTANSTGAATITPKRYFGNTRYYVKLRDDMGFTATGSFTFSVRDQDLTQRDGITSYTTGSNSQYTYYVGGSTVTEFNSDNASNVDGVVFNPNGTGIYTVFVPKPIVQNENALYINAANLYTDADSTTYDDIVITSIANATSNAYTISADAADYKYGRGYTRVAIRHNGASQSSGYISSVTLTVRSVEKSTNTILGTARTVQLVFKVDNTRPTLRQDRSDGAFAPDPYYALNVGDTKTINVADICTDGDLNRNEIKEIVVPTNEFVYLDTYGNYMYQTLSSRSNYFLSADLNAKIEAEGATNSLQYTAQGTKALKFEPSSIVDAAANTAHSYLSYTISPDGQSMSITGLRATRYQYGETGRIGDFYFLVRIEDKGNPSDMGIWFPVAVKVNNTRPSQVQPAAIADASTVTADPVTGAKVAYFSPMGLGTLSAADVNDDTKHITGLAEDSDMFSVNTDASHNEASKTYMYNEFLVLDMTQFKDKSDEYPLGKIENEYYRIEPVELYASATTAAKIAKGKPIAGVVNDMSWQRYDEWGKDIKLYSSESNDIITFYGIKVTFLRSTGGLYIQQPIVVKDTRRADNSATSPVSGNLDGLVNLLIKADNNPVTLRSADEILAGNNEKVIARREYKDKDTATWMYRTKPLSVSVSGSTVSYTVPNGFTFEITPYDLARDIDMADGWVVGENTNTKREFLHWNNPFTADSNSGVYRLDTAYSEQFDAAHADRTGIYCTANPLELSTTPQALKLDRLVFDGSAQMLSSAGGSAHVTTDETTRMSYITVDATSRTSSGNPLVFRVKISDGASSVDVAIQVHVTDNLPELRTDVKNNVFYLSSNFMGLNADTTNSSDDFSYDNFTGDDLYGTGYNVREFRPTDLAEDYEPDTLYFADADITLYSLVKMDSNDTVVFDGVTYYVFEGGTAYVTAEYAQASGGRTGQVLKVTAVASTQNLKGGLFVGINITDNYGYDPNANRTPIIFQVEVLNSDPVVNRDLDTGFTVVDKRDGDVSTDSVSYEWSISPSDEEEVKVKYYVASSKTVFDSLVKSGVPESRIRLLSSDNDKGQNLYLYAGRGNEGTENTLPKIPVYGIDNVVNRNPSKDNPNDVAVMFTLPNSTTSNITMASIVYFNFAGTRLNSPYPDYTQYTNKPDVAATTTDYTGKDVVLDYVDNPNWAIEINPSGSFARPMYFTVRVRDSLDNARGEIRYKGKRTLNEDKTDIADGTAQIDSCKEFAFYFNIGSMGMIVPHNVYTEGYYYLNSAGDKMESTFEYNGIDMTGGVIVPLSYFAYTMSLPGTVESPTASYAVSFNGAYYLSSSAEEIFERISLTDGATVWTGKTLNDNPFVTVNVITGSLSSITDSKYCNHDLRARGGNQAYGLIHENRQALSLAPRGPRFSTPLKLTVDLAHYKDVATDHPSIEIDENTHLPTTAKVTLDVKVDNKPITVISSTGADNTIYDYDTGISIPYGNLSAYTFKLYDSATSSPVSSAHDTLYMRYRDPNALGQNPGIDHELFDDYNRKYRDTARFLYSSLGTGNWPLTEQQLGHMIETGTGTINTENASVMLTRLAEYLGVTPTTGNPVKTTEDILALLQPVAAASVIDETPSTHTHTFDTATWVNTDPNTHWNPATCTDTADCATARGNEASHVYDDGSDTDCNVCGYVRTLTPSHTHSYATTWSYDNAEHWHECSCGDKTDVAAHTFSGATCSVCGAANPGYTAGDPALKFVNPNEGYDQYFTIDPGADSDSFTIRPLKKTTLDHTKAPGYSQSKSAAENLNAVKAYAAAKHLVAELNASGNGYEYYFPLKVIVYDTYGGTGFMESSWQLVTIKVRVNNSAPIANESLYGGTGRYFEISVTLEDKYSLSITDAVSDRDFVRREGRYAVKSELDDTDTLDWLEMNNDGTTVYPYADVAGNSDVGSTVIGYSNYNAKLGGSTYTRGSQIREQDRVIDVQLVTATNDKGEECVTALNFTALKKSASKVYLVLRFRDNHGAFADLNVLVQVNNKAPELLKRREGGTLAGTKTTENVYGATAGSPEIVMKTNDYFDIVVSPFDIFTKDMSETEKANFNPGSPNNDAFSRSLTYEWVTDETNKFIYDSTSFEGQRTNLGKYVIAEDDEPKTLRINRISTQGLNGKLSVTPQNIYSPDGSARTLTYRVQALGVASRLPLKVVVSDGQYSVSVIFTITIKSTPPGIIKDPTHDSELKDKGIDRVTVTEEDIAEKAEELGVTQTDLGEGIVYKVNMKLGDAPKRIDLKDICSDPDTGDSDMMYLYEAFSGSCFSIGGNASGITESAYVSLNAVLGSDSRAHSFTITPKNFMSNSEGSEKKFEQIVFYVMDANGQTFDYAQKVIINVYIEPNELKSTADDGASPGTKNFYDFTVKSKAAYDAAEQEDKLSKLEVVASSEQTRASTKGLVIDPDFGASKTSYSIKVYAMLRATRNEENAITGWDNLSREISTFESANVLPVGGRFTPFELKRYVYDVALEKMVTESCLDANVNTELYNHIASYFEFDFTSDGSALNFTPVNSTLGRTIPLYVEISKLDVPEDDKYSASAYFAVSVANSAPTATVEGTTNEDVFAGDSFLTFTGKIGDSRTYTIHNKEQQSHGLFADLDTNDTVTLDDSRGGTNRGWEILSSYDYGDGKGTVNTNTGYLADTTKGVQSALDVTTTSAGITVKFMRKIDVGDTTSAPFVRLPMRVYGKDSTGAGVYNDIILVVCNSDPKVRDWQEEFGEYDPNEPDKPLKPGSAIGYTLTRSTNDTYLLEATIERGKPLTVNIADIFVDPDTSGIAGITTNAAAACDRVHFVGDANRGYISDISGNAQAVHVVKEVGSSEAELFKITSKNANNSVLTVECVSYSRGSVGEAILKMADNSGSETKDIILRFTVANTAPTVRSDAPAQIDLFGSEGKINDDGIQEVEETYFSIFKFVTDVNSKDMTEYYDGLADTDSPTYLNITRITLGNTLDGSGGEIIVAPTYDDSTIVTYTDVLKVEKSDKDPQQFYIRPIPGVYGWQDVTIRVQDDGENSWSEDAGYCDIHVRVRIAYGPDVMVTNPIQIVRGRSEFPTIDGSYSEFITIGDILDRREISSDGEEKYKQYSNGYILNDFDLTGVTNKVELIKTPVDGGGTRFTLHVLPGAAVGEELGITAKCVVGSIERNVPFKVVVGENAKPTLKSEFGSETSYKFESTRESRDDGYIHLPASFFFDDDYSKADVLKFVGASSEIESVLEVRKKDQDGVNEIMLKFKANRDVNLTLEVTDETGDVVRATIAVSCPDKPDLSFFNVALLYVKANPLMFAIILVSLLLLIIILLIIILTVRKKRKMKKEIEALLVSEMEMEEQMLKLSAGQQQQTNAYYNSFGYLPPTQQTTNAPLLGQGGAPNTTGVVPPSNAIGLNPGEGSNPPPKDGDGFDGENF